MSGYSKLASLMGAHPEMTILRRFGVLNARNLLLYQAELIHLEAKLSTLVKADAESGHQDRSIYDRDWQTLIQSEHAAGGNPEQWQTIQSVRKTLREYNEALLLQRFLVQCPTPNAQDLTFLQGWMENPKMGNVYLLGTDYDTWEKPDLADLIALKSGQDQSLASRVVRNHMVRWWHHTIGWRFRKPKDSDIYANTVHYSHNTLLRISTVVGIVCASTLPVVSIVVLYVVENMAKRLGIITVFTALFSAALAILTNGRLVEIFSATAALVSPLSSQAPNVISYTTLVLPRFKWSLWGLQAILVATHPGLLEEQTVLGPFLYTRLGS